MLPRVADKDPWSQFNDFRSSPGLIPDGERITVPTGYAAFPGRSSIRRDRWPSASMVISSDGPKWKRAAISPLWSSPSFWRGRSASFPSAALGRCLWFYSVETVGPARIFVSRNAPILCRSSRQPSDSRFEDHLVGDVRSRRRTVRVPKRNDDTRPRANVLATIIFLVHVGRHSLAGLRDRTSNR